MNANCYNPEPFDLSLAADEKDLKYWIFTEDQENGIERFVRLKGGDRHAR